jgi:hypothetical protein
LRVIRDLEALEECFEYGIALESIYKRQILEVSILLFVHSCGFTQKLKNCLVSVTCVVQVEVSQSFVFSESNEELFFQHIVDLSIMQNESLQ